MGRSAKIRSQRRANRLQGLAIAAVQDTCTLLDGTSIHDLFWEVEELALYPSPAPEDTPKGPKRRARARDALLLCEYLHERGLNTFIASGEVARLLVARVPAKPEDYPKRYPKFFPDGKAPDGLEVPTAYAKFFGGEVLPLLFPGWHAWGDGSDAGLDSNRCDEYLVQQAAQRSVPLITSEEGTRPNSIRGRAAAAGVTVMTPREFWEPHMNEEDGANRLLTRWVALLPELQRKAREMFKPAKDADFVLKSMNFYLHHVLRGVGAPDVEE